MSYIGNEPTIGHFPVQTNLAGDGSATTFTMDRAPATLGAIEVSVAGVIQPTTSYSISGTTLTLPTAGTAIANTIPIFIRYLGETLSVAVPADDSVTTAKIADNAITAAKIADGTVVAAEIGADAIDGTKLADNAVDSEHYTDGSIDLAHMSVNSIDSDQYVDGSIDNAHMSVNSIDSDQYVDGSIDLAHLAADSVDGTKIADDAIDSEHYAAASIDAEHLAVGKDGALSLDATPDTDHTANGPQTSTLNAGYSSTIMDLVYLGSGGKWLEADADATGTSINLLGIALEAKTDTQAMNVAIHGSFVRDDSWNWTIGVPLYISGTLGAITATKPSGTGDIVRTVGYAVTADVIFFSPSSDYVILA